jgi:hypothetical protein
MQASAAATPVSFDFNALMPGVVSQPAMVGDD